MIENAKLTAYLTLIQETEGHPSAEHLTGLLAQMVLGAKIIGLLPEEVRAAILIGHQRGCKHEGLAPNYGLLLAQLSYWEAIYNEAEQFWFCRDQTDDGV